LKQNLKILKALDYKVPSRTKKGVAASAPPQPRLVKEESNKSSKKRKSKGKGKAQQGEGESCFTEEDFERFEKEYFVTS